MIDKRKKILETAMKLFVERGFHATPTSAITKEAGMSAGILFHYFPTKEDLVVNLYIELKKEFYELSFANQDKIQSDQGKLRLLWSNTWNWGLSNQLKFRFLKQADNSTYQQLALENPDVQIYHDEVFKFIKKLIDKKVIKDIDPEFIMISMFSLIKSLIEYLSKYPELKNDASFIEQAWEIFINSIKA